MSIKIKIMATLEVDKEEYPVPSDGDVSEDFEEYINELFHDIDGVRVRHIKILMEN